jgi:hypothetical protein
MRPRTLLASLLAFLALLAGGAYGVGADETDGTEAQARGPGCVRPYSDLSPWNTPIGTRPIYEPDTAAHVGAIEGPLSSDPEQYTYPVYWVTAGTPSVTVTIDGMYSNVTNDNRTLRRQRGSIQVRIPADAQAASGSDAQMIIVDPTTGDEWGFWRLERSSDGWEATNGYHYNIRWNGVPPRDEEHAFGSRGAGVPYFAGLVQRCEVDRGRIDHALAFGYDYPTPAYIYPASKSDGKGTDPDLPEGARLQLNPNLSAKQIRAWGCTGPCLTIARALQR